MSDRPAAGPRYASIDHLLAFGILVMMSRVQVLRGGCHLFSRGVLSLYAGWTNEEVIRHGDYQELVSVSRRRDGYQHPW